MLPCYFLAPFPFANPAEAALTDRVAPLPLTPGRQFGAAMAKNAGRAVVASTTSFASFLGCYAGVRMTRKSPIHRRVARNLLPLLGSLARLEKETRPQ